MSDLPLLVFPQVIDALRSKKSSARNTYHYPSSDQQNNRIYPKFLELQKIFNQKKIEIQQNASGLDPEQALVFETIGSVENFFNAVKKINGFEWLEEITMDEIIPDGYFFDSENQNKPLNGRLYVLMTNQAALENLLSLWNLWVKNPAIKFDIGLNKFKEIFKGLKDVRRWDVKDRLLDTGVLCAWEEDLLNWPERVVKFEIELWFRDNNEKQKQAENEVKKLITDAGGNFIASSIVNEIAYHGLIAELPVEVIKDIIKHHSSKLVLCDSIMFFRPTGQVIFGDLDQETLDQDCTFESLPLPSGSPIIALLDGLPIANHQLLQGRLIIDDPDDWASDYTTKERKHGTSMTSVVALGDLELKGGEPLRTPLYVRPIMKPDLRYPNSPRPEMIPETCLIVDLIHRAVRRMFDGDGTEQPTASSVKVINLSIGDPSRHFTFNISPLARLLDWLSFKYNVLFVVSAGNHSKDIVVNIPNKQKFEELDNESRRNLLIRAIYSDSRNRRLLSPAESINSLTVGSIHTDETDSFDLRDAQDPYEDILPSPFSAFGSGYRGAVKPDLVLPGGRCLYRSAINDNNTISIVNTILPPGVKAASTVNSISGVGYSAGTSNSAALLSHAAESCYFNLLSTLKDSPYNNYHAKYEVPLLKAMLVHGCSWSEIGLKIREILSENIKDKLAYQKAVSKWIGYGMPNISRVLGCTEQRATLLGFGELLNDQAHVFSLPLPPSLESVREYRKLTVTLAWLSPIIPTCQKYRQASLWFDINDNQLADSRIDANWQAVKRGTIQHEVFEGEKAITFMNDNLLSIKVNCADDAGKINFPIPYGLIVSLEVKEGINIPVYQEVRDSIITRVKI